jgi:DNA-binding protein H-NS
MQKSESDYQKEIADKDETISKLRKYMMAYTLAIDELHGVEGAKKIKDLAKKLLTTRVKDWTE